jgi:hypothetical protein
MVQVDDMRLQQVCEGDCWVCSPLTFCSLRRCSGYDNQSNMVILKPNIGHK